MAALPQVEAERQYVFSDADFDQVRMLIHARAGIALGAHKREMVYGRLARRLRTLGLARFSDYLAMLSHDEHAPEWQSFVNALTTNLTAFFRESHHFPILSDFVRTRPAPVSIWCCAASTGEEPYSIAMTLADTLGARSETASVLATDIDTQVLERAQEGVYPLERIDRLTEAQRQRHFLRGRNGQAGRVRVKSELRAMVQFEPLNLLAPSWPLHQSFDAIFCRNVMIYFDKSTQAGILRRFAPLLKPGGLLFAGHSENFTYIETAFRLRGQTVYELADGNGRRA